jgi:hypothetical protein
MTNFFRSSPGKIAYTDNIEDGGHFLPMDTPEQITREINAFIG